MYDLTLDRNDHGLIHLVANDAPHPLSPLDYAFSHARFTLSPLGRLFLFCLRDLALYGFHLRDGPLGLPNLHRIFQPARAELKTKIE
jgi:hypothetical protein